MGNDMWNTGSVFSMSGKSFDGLCECGLFGRTEQAFKGWSVVVCGQGDHYRATVWVGLNRVKRATGKTAEEALGKVVTRLDVEGIQGLEY